jgi:GNAT superfamily N-acetyltransferase
VEQVTFSVVPAGSPPARWALTRYFAELAERLPGGFDRGTAVDDAAGRYDPPNGAFVLVRRAGEDVGCGALVFLDGDTAEIKRMWISPPDRGTGLGKRLLAHLEEEARRAGRVDVVLDTNASLTEAIAMYESSGYVPTARYNDNPYAERWFAKSLKDD